MASYVVGGRYLHHKTKHPLTLRYIGPLPPPASPDDRIDASGSSKTTWLGVEYDDPTHGRGHSGTYEGVQVFRCGREGAGAFIKLNLGVLLEGPSFIEAFEQRYGSIELSLDPNGDQREHRRFGSGAGDGDSQTVELGTSGIVVEAPGLKEVQRRIGQLERLREVGLEGQWIGDVGGDTEIRRRMRERLKGVRQLDISSNLLRSWDEVADIVACFPNLRSLILNHSRVSPIPSDLEAKEVVIDSLEGVTHVYLPDAGLDWESACTLSTIFPSLQELHLNDNPLICDISTSPFHNFQNLTKLSLAACPISDWLPHIASMSTALPSLLVLDISATAISTVPPLAHDGGLQPLRQLKSLIWSECRLREWTSMDCLSQWVPGLESLRISSISSSSKDSGDLDGLSADKPTASGPPLSTNLSGDDHFDRPIIIAKFASLQTLNSTHITSDERRDAEMSYVRQVSEVGAKLGQGQDQLESAWWRYSELKAKHGLTDFGSAKTTQAKVANSLRSKMITLTVIHHQQKGDPFDLLVLPSSSIVTLKRKVAKKVGKEVPRLRLWTLERETTDVKGLEVHEGRDVEWWFGDGDKVLWSLRPSPG